MVEEYLDGTEVDIDVVMCDGKAVYNKVTDNWPTLEPWFNETGDNAPSMFEADKQKELEQLAEGTLQCLGFRTGVFHVEVSPPPPPRTGWCFRRALQRRESCESHLRWAWARGDRKGRLDKSQTFAASVLPSARATVVERGIGRASRNGHPNPSSSDFVRFQTFTSLCVCAELTARGRVGAVCGVTPGQVHHARPAAD